jgi:uncharacterized protein (TIGR02996 family)
MTHDDAFLQAILENPGDDTPRLIYADWLMERDDPGRADRGLFIRLQVELARLPDEDARRPPLAARAQELLDGHRDEWVRPLGPWGEGCAFHRGFVEEVEVEPARSLAALGDLFRLAPVRHLRVRGLVRDPWATLMPDAEDAEAMELCRDHARALAASPHLARLSALTLRYNHLGAAEVEALLHSPHLARLTALDLGHNPLGDDGAEALAASPGLAGLTRLDLEGCGLTDRGLQALLATRYGANLRTLGLRGATLSVGALLGLSGAPALPALEQVLLDARLHAHLADYHRRHGDYTRAVAEYTEALKLQPGSASDYRMRGRCHYQQGEYAQALADYNEALRLEPGGAESHSDRADALRQLGEYGQAVAEYTEALRLEPGRAWDLCFRGRSYHLKGERGRAVADFRRALEQDPRDALTCNLLAWVCATCPLDEVRDAPKALHFALRACQLTDWSEGYALDTLAAAHAEAGDFAEAIRWQTAALKHAQPVHREAYQSHLELYRAGKPYRLS